MAAGNYDFIIEQGATFSKQITWKDSTGTPINLSSYTISGKIRRKSTDQNQVAAFTCTKADQGTSPGVFTISLTAAVSATLPTKAGSTAEKELLACVYDVIATSGSEVYRLLEGIVKISPAVT